MVTQRSLSKRHSGLSPFFIACWQSGSCRIDGRPGIEIAAAAPILFITFK